MKFKVIMRELQRDGTERLIEQYAVASSEQAVIDWYGLKEPDIIEFKIEKID